jgi:hypothetical protein
LWIGDGRGKPYPERVTKNSLVIPKPSEIEKIPEGKKRRKRSRIKINNGNVYDEGTVHNANEAIVQNHKKQKRNH